LERKGEGGTTNGYYKTYPRARCGGKGGKGTTGVNLVPVAPELKGTYAKARPTEKNEKKTRWQRTQKNRDPKARPGATLERKLGERFQNEKAPTEKQKGKGQKTVKTAISAEKGVGG